MISDPRWVPQNHMSDATRKALDNWEIEYKTTLVTEAKRLGIKVIALHDDFFLEGEESAVRQLQATLQTAMLKEI